MKRATFWMTIKQLERLAAVAREKGLKPSQLVRLYVSDGLAKDRRVSEH